MRTVGSPASGDGMLVATCGQGGRGESMICVAPGGEGDAGSNPLKYVRPKSQGVPYVPTPIIHNGRIYLWNDDGTFFLANLTDGKNITRERIGGQYFSSPVMVDGKLFTPELDRCGVAGVGRAEVLAACPQTQVGELTLDALLGASEIFLSSSVRGILPVHSLDERRYAPGALARQLQQHWHNLGFSMEQDG